MRPFVELSSATIVVSLLDFEESHPRGASLRFDPSSISSTSKSSRFSFTVSHHFDSLKPWYLSFKDTSESKLSQINRPHAFLGPRISPLNARSISFASPIARAPRGNIAAIGNGFFPSTPMPQRTQKVDPLMIHHPRTPKPSFLQSPALFFRKKNEWSRVERSSESFAPFLKFYLWPYDEMIYRSKMRPPLGGLISIVSTQFRRGHMSISQRF